MHHPKIKQNEDSNALLETIEEVKVKLNITERTHKLHVDKMSEAIKKNDQTIHQFRTKNSNYRSIMRSAIDSDRQLVSNAFKNREKDLLAFKNKPVEVVVKEVDQTVCDLARKMNALVYLRQKKLKEYEKIKQKLKETRTVPIQGDLTNISNLSVMQLENAFNKLQLKQATAGHIFKVYEKIKEKVEADLKFYPQTLGDLEEKIVHQKQELSHLIAIEASAHQDKEISMISKNNCERAVRSERKKRELVLKELKHSVQKINQQEISHPAVMRRTVRQKNETSVDSTKLVSTNRIQTTVEKINVYKYKAEMLETVTGIPFINEKTMLKCLKNQKKSSYILDKQYKQKKEEFSQLKKMMADYKLELHDLMHNEERRISNLIEETERELANAVDNSEALEYKLKKQRHQLFNLEEYLAAMAIYLKYATSTLPNIDFNCNMKDAGLLDVFNEVLRVFFLLYADISNKLKHTDSTSEFQVDNFIIRKRDICNLIPENNNRIKYKIEKRVYDEFGEYNQPTNEEYLSRDAIKARSGTKKRR